MALILSRTASVSFSLFLASELFNGHGVEERHHRAQFRTHLLDQLFLFFLPRSLKPPATRLILPYPVLGVRAILDFFQHLLHRLPRLLGNDSWTAGVVSMFGGVTDRTTHVVQAAAVNEVHNEF